MADYKRTVTLNDAYDIDVQLLKDIFELGQVFLNYEDISVEFEFGKTHKLNAELLDDLLNDSVLRTDVITKIRMSGHDLEAEPRRRFNFIASDGTFDDTYRLEVEGSQAACTALSSQVEALLKAKRQWYSFMILKPSVVSITSLLVLAGAILAIPAVVAVFLFPPAAGPIAVFELVFALLFLWLLNSLRAFLFPKLIIEIGRSAEVGTNARSARKFVFGTVLAALIVGVAASLIANFLSRPAA